MRAASRSASTVAICCRRPLDQNAAVLLAQTRGFTGTVVSTKSAYMARFERFSQIVRRWPLTTTFAFASARGVVGDVAAQHLDHKVKVRKATAEGRELASDFKIDWMRVRCYVVWTVCVAYTIDRYLYAIYIPKWFPTYVNGKFSWANVWKASALDNFLSTPFFYYPAFYVTKEHLNHFLASRDDQDATLPQPSVQVALQRYYREAPEQLASCWLYWVPVHLINFGLVPPHLRIGFVSVVATGFVTVLSYVTHHLDERTEQQHRTAEK